MTHDDPEWTLERLRERYGDFRVQADTVEVHREAYVGCLRAAEREELGGARVLVEDDGRVLLVRYDDSDAWDAPGGDRQRRESHEATARRHVAEQVGLECELTDVVRVLRYEFVLAEGSDGVVGLWPFFEATASGADVATGDGVVEARWFEDVPEAAAPDVQSGAASVSN